MTPPFRNGFSEVDGSRDVERANTRSWILNEGTWIEWWCVVLRNYLLILSKASWINLRMLIAERFSIQRTKVHYEVERSSSFPKAFAAATTSLMQSPLSSGSKHSTVGIEVKIEHIVTFLCLVNKTLVTGCCKHKRAENVDSTIGLTQIPAIMPNVTHLFSFEKRG